jgi:hypothetical protein
VNVEQAIQILRRFAVAFSFSSPMTDPFTQISRTILAALQADAGWAALVKRGNVVDMTSPAFERFRTQVQSGDVPEVVLVQEDFRLRPFGTNSRVAELEQDFQMIVTHDSLRVMPVNVLKFRTLAALARCGPTLGLDGLVREWEITGGADDAIGSKPWKRGSERWVSAMTIRVQMYFTRDRLVSVS